MQDLIKISKNLKLEMSNIFNKIDLESILKQYFINAYLYNIFWYDLMSQKGIDIVLQLGDNNQKINKPSNNILITLIDKGQIIKIYYTDIIHSHYKKRYAKGTIL